MMLLTLVSLLPELDLPLAHDTNMPHEEGKSGSSNASAILIVVVVLATLVLLGGLIWLKERARRADRDEAAEPGGPPAADPLSDS